ncbi:MAG TPA: ABC transporter ATP-binding protein [Puia sp.]|nr:ABC transporter ATP-binding protein [Puia sp.]
MKKIVRNTFAILNRREKQKFGLLILLNLFISIIDIASLAFLLIVVNFYTRQFAVNRSLLPEFLSDQHSLLLIAAFLLFFSLKSIAGYYILRAQYQFVYKTASRISENNLLNYLEGSYSNYVKMDSSVLVRKITHQPIEFAHYVLSGIQQIITESILVILTIIAILFFSAKLFLFLFVILLPAVFAIVFFVRKRLKSVRANVKATSEKSLQYLHESITGFVESNLYDKNDFFSQRYAVHQRSLNKYLAELQITQGISSRIIEVFAILGLFILIAANKIMGNGNVVELATITAFVAAAYKIIPGIVKILNMSSHVKAYEFTVNDLVAEVKFKKHIQQKSFLKIQSISFDDVSLTYNRNRLFNNVSFEICKGDFIGITGISGKGKTTIANLLLGFLEPSSGTISVNEKIKNENERREYWNDISYVKQQPFLIHDSIINNIVLGDEHYDKKKLQNALKVSGLLDLINKFPEGLQKIISENGKNISGGQRQRIAIARAIYKNASLIILDEPFNELDEGAEYAMLDYFKCLTKSGKIILLITHNKKSFSFCNKMISLNEE